MATDAIKNRFSVFGGKTRGGCGGRDEREGEEWQRPQRPSKVLLEGFRVSLDGGRVGARVADLSSDPTAFRYPGVRLGASPGLVSQMSGGGVGGLEQTGLDEFDHKWV